MAKTETMSDAEYIDADQFPTTIDMRDAIDAALAVEIVERAMWALNAWMEMHPSIESAVRCVLEREFGLTEEK